VLIFCIKTVVYLDTTTLFRVYVLLYGYTVPSSYNCTHVCDFSRGTIHFYSVSEVQIHAWFRPMATRGSQRGCKYYHACIAKAVLFHAWVVLITTIVLYQCRMSIQSLLHRRVLATTSTSTKNTLVIVIWDSITFCVAMSVQWLTGLNQPCTG